MLPAFKIATLVSLAGTALGHGYVSGIVADGVYTGGWSIDYFYDIENGVDFPQTPGWYEEALDLGFVAPSNYQTPDIICHKNSANANVSATVAAGGSIDFQWTEWPHTIGPVLTYVANCGEDCKSVDKTKLEFVKIDESGVDLDTQVWASQVLIDNNNTWTTKVPESLAPGHYVFRHEIIACHGAGSVDGAQNYPFCLNIDVTGSGTENPTGTLATDFYQEEDPGIHFNPYTTLTSYEIPGPALWTG